MLQVSSLPLPKTYPHPNSIRSCGENLYAYDPEFWEFDYFGYRYLSRVSAQGLVKRYCAIAHNMKRLVRAERHDLQRAVFVVLV